MGMDPVTMMAGASLVSGLVSGGLGAAGVGGSNASIQTRPSLDPNQQALWDAFMPYFQQQAGGQNYQVSPWGPTSPYQPGDQMGWAQGLTPMQQQATSMVSNAAANPFPMESLYGAAQDALKGITPAQATDLYKQNVLPGQQRMFQENVLPGVKEAYGQTGTFSGSDRARAEANAYSQFGQQQGQNLQDFIKYGMESGRRAIPSALQVAQSTAPYMGANAMMAAGEMQRQIQQQEQLARFEEMKRTDPAVSPWIDRIIQLLGLGTTTSMGIPGTPSPLATVGGGLMGMAGAFMGMGGGGAGAAAGMPTTMYPGAGGSGGIY